MSTATQRSVVTDAQGRFTFDAVVPGTYRLQAKSPSFAEMQIESIEVLVNEPVTIPIQFSKVGTTAETISVAASTDLVNTVDATIGNAIESNQIVEIPSYARNVATLLTFQPGVNQSGNVNGGKSDQGNITLDGADVNNQNTRAAMSSVLNITMDSVQEFRVTTTNGNADEGRTSGAQITFVTKSGTNQLHGSLYEYRRGTETAANDFFNNASALPKPALLINIFGGSAGGPIKKNKIVRLLQTTKHGATPAPTRPSAPFPRPRQILARCCTRALRERSIPSLPPRSRPPLTARTSASIRPFSACSSCIRQATTPPPATC